MLLSFSVCSQGVTLSERTARLVLKDLVELDSCNEVVDIQDSIIFHYTYLAYDLETALALSQRQVANDSLMFKAYDKNEKIYLEQIEQSKKELKLWKIGAGVLAVAIVVSLFL
jgi:hypothetical protein